MDVNCGNCHFFIKVAGQVKGGQCRFSPPTPMVIGARQVPGLTGFPGASGGIEPVIASQFPPVAEDTWCGCFRPRVQPVALEPHLIVEPDYVVIVHNGLADHPALSTSELIGQLMKDSGGKLNPVALRAEIEAQMAKADDKSG